MDARFVLILFLGVCGGCGAEPLTLPWAAGRKAKGVGGSARRVEGAGVSLRFIIMAAVVVADSYRVQIQEVSVRIISDSSGDPLKGAEEGSL